MPYAAVSGSSIELYACRGAPPAGDSFDIEGITLTSP